MFETLILLGYAFLTLIVGIITAAIVYARWTYGSLEKAEGIPKIIKPYFIGGSDPFWYKKIVCEDDMENVKKYGPIFGMYDGRFPTIFISDPELIRLIFIKDFDHFHNKRIFETGHELVNEMMDLLPYEKWKVVRNTLSPQLTTGKIRAMSHQMSEAINDWVNRLGSKVVGERHEFVTKNVYSALTIDVIARCAFGTKINVLDNPDDKFFKYVRLLSFEDAVPDFTFTIGMLFPMLAKLAPIFPTEGMDFFGSILSSITASRRSSGERVNDFVDSINDMVDKCSTPEYEKLGITEKTVMCQAMIFLIAGFETTATTLSLMSYHLATEPKIQEKLIKEVDEYLEKHGGVISHETIGELIYVHAVMNETLRLHPQLIRVERECVKDWFHKPTGLLIRKGHVVQVPVYAVHYDEKNFPNPLEFNPDRFMPENKDKLNSYAFLSFGQGPHNCIGMRFAKEEIQMTMANIIKDFKFQDVEEGAKLKLKPGRNFLNTYEPFSLNLVKRH